MKTMPIFTLLYLALVISFLHPSHSELCHPQDKKVLLQINQAFNNALFWDPKTDCCDWANTVFCDEKTHRVNNLLLGQVINLVGPIPPQVFDLPYLESLEFHKNPYLTGPIPPSISKLKRLRYLTITWTNISGPIPDSIGDMKSLERIFLNYNSLTGPIPSSIARLPNLTELYLDRNQLTGPIPDSFAEFKADDFSLYLSHNKLSGKIPASLGKKDFNSIDLSRNNLEGDPWPLLGPDKKKLWNLDLSRNSFEFDLSKVKLPKSLFYLDLNHNKIFGGLLEELTKLNLQLFNVSYNRLCGKIPVGGNLQTSFDYSAYFHNRCLCGAPLPSCK